MCLLPPGTYTMYGLNLVYLEKNCAAESTSQKKALASVYCYYEKKVDPFG